MSLPATMKAVVFHGPYDVKTEVRPTPTIQDPKDAIVKVSYSGLCGTDLHPYRGHIKGAPGQIVGHEFIGTVVSVGSAVSNFKINDKVLSAFTIQCGECWYCLHGYTGQCDKTNTFGKVGLDGGQAEYVRIPYADSTLVLKPLSKDDVDDSVYVLMADIFITGYFGVKKIVDQLSLEAARGYPRSTRQEVSILQIGCGPVGLCALKIAKHLGFQNIVVLDSIPSRLEQALEFGAKKAINFEKEPEALKQYIVENTGNVGFDAVLEVVGATSALRTAYESVRRNGFISSLGMAIDPLPFTGIECYVKNINISFGRCHVRALFPEALDIFEELKGELQDFIDCKVGLDESENVFDLFEKHKVNKVVFDLQK
ncbi:alcohol dehydrogenase 2 [[Candida] anglica]|uniref:Alcohol dehydrogenase 2 n=1 Tax=[Candida] anglica TaxID=148631 RepID=A0ABP0E7E5_9ASCO